MVYDYVFEPTPSPKPVTTATPTPVPVEEESSSMHPALRAVLTVLLILLVIGLIRLAYVLFWKLRMRGKPNSEKASILNQYYRMHLYILEGKGSRAVKKIVDKAEYSRDSISDKEISYLIRFGEHNLGKQKKGASRVRKIISFILRVKM